MRSLRCATKNESTWNHSQRMGKWPFAWTMLWLLLLLPHVRTIEYYLWLFIICNVECVRRARVFVVGGRRKTGDGITTYLSGCIDDVGSRIRTWNQAQCGFRYSFEQRTQYNKRQLLIKYIPTRVEGTTTSTGDSEFIHDLICGCGHNIDVNTECTATYHYWIE